MMNQLVAGKGKVITMEQAQMIAPSIFSTHARNDVSEKYAFIPTINIIETLKTEGWNMVKVQQQMVRDINKRPFTKHLVRFRREGQTEINDVFPEIVLINSHDRGCAYQMMAGLFRLVCTNGLVIADSTFSKISVRHSGKIVDDVRRSADLIAKETPKIIEKVEQFQAIELTRNEQGVFAQAAKRLKYGEESPLDSSLLLLPRRSTDNQNNLWSTFNIIQENITKGGFRYTTPAHQDEKGNYVPTRRGKTRSIKGLNEDTKLNKALWYMTEMMAKLKKDGSEVTVG